MKSALVCLLLALAPPIISQSNAPSRNSQTPLGLSPASSQTSGLNFAPEVSYGTGGVAVVLKDVNRDGNLDIVVANGGLVGGIAVLLGNGDGTFQPGVTYASGGQNPYSVAVADVNGDGILDLVAANFGVVGVLLGNGDGTFQSAARYFLGSFNPASVATGDVDGDGKLDLLVCGGGSVGVLLNNGDGTFKGLVSYSSGGANANSIAVADVNNDGKLDLLVANEGPDLGSVAVLFGKGDGTFPTTTTLSTGGEQPDFVTAADVNEDGNLDLIVANYFSGGVGVLLGNGDGTFQAATVWNSGGLGISLAVGDMNGDGKLDLIVQNGQFSNRLPGLGVLLGNGDGTFQSHIDFAGPGAPAVADLNGDGKLDVVVSSGVGVLINISKIPTATSLVSSPNPSNFNQSVTFTATVTKQFGGGVPTGRVTFLDVSTTTTLGTSKLNSSGVATLQVSTLGPSTHSITAKYNESPALTSSTSPSLSQVVLGATAKLSPASLTFGNQTVAIVSSPQSITLTNGGDIPLTFSSITFTGSNAADFHQTNNCGSSLAGGATCMFSVTFKPTAAGALSAALTITDNALHNVQKVPVSGLGVLPAVTFSAASLTFPTQVIYTTSKAQTVTLTNSGQGILNISKIVATGEFSQTNNCGSTLAPTGTCTLTVKFQPTSLDTLTGSISVTDNAPVSPQSLPLTGVGTAIQLSPVSLNFGNQPVDTRSLPKAITVSNKSHQTVNITSIAIHGADPSDFHVLSTTCGASLASGASCFVKVNFSPTTTGKRAATLVISDDGGGEVQRAGLAGTGT